MSYGKDERHIDKHLWQLPIPLYDADNPEHIRLMALGQQQADVVAHLDIDVGSNFVTLRRQVRQILETTEAAAEIASLVEGMLG
jgi:hypothetical protein